MCSMTFQAAESILKCTVKLKLGSRASHSRLVVDIFEVRVTKVCDVYNQEKRLQK